VVLIRTDSGLEQSRVAEHPPDRSGNSMVMAA